MMFLLIIINDDFANGELACLLGHQSLSARTLSLDDGQDDMSGHRLSLS